MGGHRLPAAVLPPGLIVDQVQMGSGAVAAVARGRVETPGLWQELGRGPWSLLAIRFGPAGARTVRPDRTRRAAVQGRDRGAPRRDLCGTVRRGHRRPLRPPHGAAAKPRLQNRDCKTSSTLSGTPLCGRPGQGLARRLLTPGSKDTVLWTVRARAPAARPTPRGIGIDDGAWRRGPGWRIASRSRFSRAAEAMASRLLARRRKRSRSPIAGA